MTSGIYCFEHRTLPIIYIGSSKNIEKRLNSHIKDFCGKRHNNKTLQHDYLADKLHFYILEENVPKKMLFKRENYYFNLYLKSGYLLYNRVPPIATPKDYYFLCGLKSPQLTKEGQDLKALNRRILELEKRLEQVKDLNRELNETNVYLKKEVELLKIRNNTVPNIFEQIELYGEIKEGF